MSNSVDYAARCASCGNEFLGHRILDAQASQLAAVWQQAGR
ncbi:hypothetical protein ACFLWA_12575 [Chloroflexota bacterium]